MVFNACETDRIEITTTPLPLHEKEEKPDTPVPLGCIRVYLGEYYRTFSQPDETDQSAGSYINTYFYGECSNGNIHIIRHDSNYVFAIYLSGYSLESLPVNQPLPEEYGKYPRINFFPYGQWNWGDPSFYSLAHYIQKCVFIITDKTDDILTGTFDGMLVSSTGNLLPLSEGEFKIKIYRKEMPCGNKNQG